MVQNKPAHKVSCYTFIHHIRKHQANTGFCKCLHKLQEMYRSLAEHCQWPATCMKKTIKTKSNPKKIQSPNIKNPTLEILPHLPRLGDRSADLDLDPRGDLDDFHWPRSASDLYIDFLFHIMIIHK